MVSNSSLKDPVILVADRGYESYNTFADLEEKGWNDVIRVKDLKSNSMVSLLVLPDEYEFAYPVHFILTRKQTNEVKSNPHRYKFLPNHARFDYFKLKADAILSDFVSCGTIQTNRRYLRNAYYQFRVRRIFKGSNKGNIRHEMGD